MPEDETAPIVVGAKQRPLHELTALLGAQPAEYSTGWGYAPSDLTERQGKLFPPDRPVASGNARIRQDREKLGMHPCGAGAIDANKTATGHRCGTCLHRQKMQPGATHYWRCSAIPLPRLRHKAHQHGNDILMRDPACARHEYDGYSKRRAKADEPDTTTTTDEPGSTGT